MGVTNFLSCQFARSQRAIRWLSRTVSQFFGITTVTLAIVWMVGLPRTAGAAIIGSGEELIIEGYYPDDAFIIHRGGVLTFNYSGANAFDYGRGTLFDGFGTLRKTGSGTVFWGNKTTTFSLSSGSLIDVQQGTLVGGSHGNENWSSNLSDLRVAAGAHFAGVEANVRVGTLLGSGRISSGYNGSGYQHFTFGVSNGHGTFDGILTDNEQYAGKYVKVGGGTQTFTGANTFTGGLEIRAGRVALGNGGTTGSVVSNIHVDSTGELQFNRSGTYTHGSVISGSGNVQKSGSGTLKLTGNNTFTGSFQIDSGSVEFSTINNLGASKIYGNGGTLRWASGSSVDISPRIQEGSHNILGFDTNGNNVSLAGNLTAIQINKVGSGTLTLSGSNSIYAVTIAQGRVSLGSANALKGTQTTINEAGTLDIGSQSFNSSVYGTGEITSSNGGTLLAGGSINNRITGNTKVVVNSSVELYGTNTYTGGTTINAGTLYLYNANALGNGAISVAAGATVTSLDMDLSIDNMHGPGTARAQGGNLVSKTSGSATSSVTFWYQPFIKTGAGTLTLSSNNAQYTSDTTIQAGKLILGNALALGNGIVNVATGAILDTAGFSFNVARIRGAGVVTGQGAWSYSGNTDLSANLAGSASLSIGGTGYTNITGTNTFTGGLYLNSAILEFTRLENLGAGPISLGQGTLRWKGANTADVSSLIGPINSTGGKLDLNSNEIVFQSSLSGTGKVTLAGEGRLTLAAANSFSGIYNLASATLVMGHAEALKNASIVFSDGSFNTVDIDTYSLDLTRVSYSTFPVAHPALIKGNSGGTLTYNSSADHNLQVNLWGGASLIKSGSGHLFTNRSYGLKGDTIINGGTLTVELNNTLSSNVYIAEGATFRGVDYFDIELDRFSGTGTVDTSAYLTYNKLQEHTVTNRITGDAKIRIEGGGTVTLTGDNSYTDETYVANSKVILGHANGLGSGTIFLSNAALDIGDHELNLSRIAWGSGTLSGSASGTYFYNSSNNHSISSKLTDAVNLRKQGSGSLSLSANSSHTGNITVENGILSLATDYAGKHGNISIASGATLALTGSSRINLHRVSGSGVMTGYGSFFYDADEDHTLNVSLGGDGRLEKSGTGTLVLARNHTYRGETTVNGGQLIVNGTMGAGGRTVVNKGTLGGSGTHADLVLQTGATISPGNSSGVLKVAGNTTWQGGTVYQWEVADALGEAGVGYDLLDLQGSLYFEGAFEETKITIALTSLNAEGQDGPLNFSEDSSYRFTLLRVNGSMIAFSLSHFQLDTSAFGLATDGTWSLELTEKSGGIKELDLLYTAAIPEPSSLLLVSGALLGGFLLRRGKLPMP